MRAILSLLVAGFLSVTGAGMDFSGAALFATQMAEDLYATTPELEIPFYVVQGADDLFTPTGAARGYPEKEMFVLDGAGHFALVTNQEAFLGALRAIAADVEP